MDNIVQDMFSNAVEVDHLTDEQVEGILKMFGDNN